MSSEHPIDALLRATKQKEKEVRIELASLEGRVAEVRSALAEHTAVVKFIEQYNKE